MVQDRDEYFDSNGNANDIHQYFYHGKTTTREFEYHWDLELPYHCSVVSGTACAPFVFVQSDITNNVSILRLLFTWFTMDTITFI